MPVPSPPETPPAPHVLLKQWLPRAQRGHSGAQFVIGRLFAENGRCARDFQRARFWLNKSAAGGYGEAQAYLALLYRQGTLGFDQDNSRAVYWLKKAAESGIAGAQYYLSKMYAQGIGVQRSYVYAYMWAMIAATGSKAIGVIVPDPVRLRENARRALEVYTQRMTPIETSAAIRMAKKWRVRILNADCNESD